MPGPWCSRAALSSLQSMWASSSSSWAWQNIAVTKVLAPCTQFPCFLSGHAVGTFCLTLGPSSK